MFSHRPEGPEDEGGVHLQTMTSHKGSTSSCTPQGFCLCPQLHFISWLSHASLFQRYHTLPRRRTEVEQGQPRSPKNYPLLHPFLSGSLKTELQLEALATGPASQKGQAPERGHLWGRLGWTQKDFYSSDPSFFSSVKSMEAPVTILIE